ncbi:uncharacterized protein LOC117115711 [Anneissia japonica]|uniref:uncharacterized protein LOC117115711 n=1 Tax=Anneissia japonica TaxID=1529436 RepID=UPI001425A4C6|nr:uncharacterized protein LOC117115711 [Anneissia japonica]
MNESDSELVSTSKRKKQDQGSGDASTSKRQKVDQAISDEDFMELKSVVSKWFDQRRYINKLKVFYTDLLSPAVLHNASTTTINLLNCLTDHDELSSTNLTLIYDTIKVSKQFGLVKKIKEQLPSCPIPANIKDTEISSYTPHRLKLMKLGSLLTEDDVPKIDQLYNDALKKYADSWCLIMDLEKRSVICEENMEKFITKLKNLELKKAVDALCKGNQKDPEHVISLDPEHHEQLRRDIIIRNFLTKRQKQMYQNVNQMTPTIWHEHHEVDIAEVFTELILIQSDEDEELQAKSTLVQKKGRPTSLTEVLGVIKLRESCKVLITGKGGMGKTTLLRYIAHQWATDNVDNAFANKLLFLINIRDLKAGQKFLDIIMEKIDWQTLILKNKLPPNSIEDFLVTHADEIVILLDGYDELKKGAKDPIDLFERTELGECTVLMSSRPDNVIKFFKWCNIHIKVMGFSPRNKKKYIHKHFVSIGKAEIGDSLIREFGLDKCKDDGGDDYYEDDNVYANYTNNDDYFTWYGDDYYEYECYHTPPDSVDEVLLFGGDHKEAFELCSSPLLLLKICTIWQDKQCLPKDLSDLFKELFCSILNQYQNRGGNGSSIFQFERIPEKYRHAIQILGECIYEGLKENKLSIDKYVLLNKENDKHLVHLALELGFVYKDSPVQPGDVREIYTTPHKLISESLAGFYLFEKSQQGSLKAEEYEVIRCSEYLQMTRVFTIGFLGADVCKLFKHWLIIRASNFYSIAQCLRYVKEDYEDHVVQELDKHMSIEMKEHCEQMCESVRSVLDDKDLTNVPLFKLMRKYNYLRHNNVKLEKAFPLINTSNEESLKNSCRSIVQNTVVLPRVYKTNYFLRYISKWENKAINMLSGEMEKLDLTYCNLYFIKLGFDCSLSFLIHFLKHANDLYNLHINHWPTAASKFNLVFNELHKTHVRLKIRFLDIKENDLASISGRTLACLVEMSPHLTRIDMSYCNLAGSNISEMMDECCRMNVVLKDKILKLTDNDLSNIDGKYLAKLVRVIDESYAFRWSDYLLTSDILEKLVKSIGENETLNWKMIDISGINLSSISGKTLAHLFKISTLMINIDMSHCNLSGSIINEMMEECCKINLVLKDGLLTLMGNDLSDSDGKSFAALLGVIYAPYTFKWQDYSLTAEDVEKLVESIGQNETLNWERIDMSRINLSSIRGRTLAHLLKACTHLIHIDMSDCSLSGCIVNEMMDECHRMNVELNNNMLKLESNDLSDINGKSLTELVRVIYEHYTFKWKDYSLTSDNLEKLVESISENETLDWERIDMSRINLSSIKGRTLAHLLKACTHLIYIDMSHCSLSGSIINEMMEECCRMNVELKENMFTLEGNDLSDIDSKSLAELYRVRITIQPRIMWDEDDDFYDYY